MTSDAGDNLTALYNMKSDSTVISSFDYAVDKVGKRTSVVEANGDRVTWSYDHSYQLTREQRSGANSYDDEYKYDSVGNRKEKTADGARTTTVYDAANQISYSEGSIGKTTYAFDADGNQQIVEEPNGDRTTTIWDYENQSTLYQLPSGALVTMSYNADNRRVRKES